MFKVYYANSKKTDTLHFQCNWTQSISQEQSTDANIILETVKTWYYIIETISSLQYNDILLEIRCETQLVEK